jgi:hypothetical protein
MRIPLPRARRAPLGALVGAFTLALAGLPAAAQAACPTTPTTQAFSAFGDTAQYTSVPNGYFESGTGGWSLGGATVATGNEPWYVRSSSDRYSLAIPATSVVTSPAVCIDQAHPTVRFFARRTSGTWGTLNVKLLWKDSTGQTNTTTVASINGADTAWHATDPLAIASALPLWNADQTLQVQLVFDAEDYGGAWAIDDVYVDPWNRS